NGQSAIRNPQASSPGLWSELRFRLRRPLGILTGTIDKLLITPSANGDGFDVEIIDFKTNRFRSPAKEIANRSQIATAAVSPSIIAISAGRRSRTLASQPAQGAFNFESPSLEVSSRVDLSAEAPTEIELPIKDEIEAAARDYQLQMQ